MNALGKFKHKNINCIPQNHEKCFSFSLWRLDFFDTFQLLSTSLDKLSTNLAKDVLRIFPDLKAYVATTHPGGDQTKFQLFSRNGVYPYRYMNLFKQIQETTLTLHEMPSLNYEPKLSEMKRILNQWKLRKLNAIGKILELKTLILPKFNHLVLSLLNSDFDFTKTLFFAIIVS